MEPYPSHPIWTKKQFLFWSFLGLVAAVLFSSSSPLFRGLGMLVNVVFLATLPKWIAPKNQGYFKTAIAIIIVVSVVVSVALFVLPENVNEEFSFFYVIHHPALVWPLWLSVIGMGYWRWDNARNCKSDVAELKGT